MKNIVDLMAIFGGLATSGGVYLEFGLGYALITGGGLLIGLALKTASVINATDQAG